MILTHFPNIYVLRKILTKFRIWVSKLYFLKEEEVIAAEENADKKKEIVSRLSSRWPRKIKKVKQQINSVMAMIPDYKSRRNDDALKTDMLFCYFAYGFFPNEYYAFKLEKKSREERESFVSERQRFIYRCMMNNILKADLFADKMKTYEKFKPYYGREAISISRKRDYAKFHEFVKKHPVFVKKQVLENEGRSVALIDMKTCGKTEQEVFDELIGHGKHILEERIVQTPDMAAFNKTSVNTVRAITFYTRHGIVVPYCTLRTGKEGSFIDNGIAGGAQACIDYNTGIISTDGYDEMGGVFLVHPSSGTVFKGYQLPEWKKLQNIITDIAAQVPDFKIIGWDFAHTKDGWVVIEGNESARIIAQQMIKDEGIKHIYEELMADMDLIV